MTEQLNLWKAALEVAFDQTCQVGRPNDWKLIKDALESVNAALTHPAQPAEGGETIGEAQPMPGTPAFTHCIWDARAVPPGTKLYTAPPASQEQAQQPSGGGVVAWRLRAPVESCGLQRFMTQAKYEKQTPAIQKWYEPFKCQNCATPKPEP